MLTPVDLQNKVFKGGIGFDKKDVESFMSNDQSCFSMRRYQIAQVLVQLRTSRSASVPALILLYPDN